MRNSAIHICPACQRGDGPCDCPADCGELACLGGVDPGPVDRALWRKLFGMSTGTHRRR